MKTISREVIDRKVKEILSKKIISSSFQNNIKWHNQTPTTENVKLYNLFEGNYTKNDSTYLISLTPAHASDFDDGITRIQISLVDADGEVYPQTVYDYLSDKDALYCIYTFSRTLESKNTLEEYASEIEHIEASAIKTTSSNNRELALFIYNIANIGTLQQEQRLHKILEKYASDIDLRDLSDLDTIEEELNRLSSEQVERLEKLLENNYSEREQRMFSKASLRSKANLKSLASLGEDRDDLADKLISARNLILEASDNLADAYNHLGKISSSEAEKLKTGIMNTLDGEENSIVEDLHRMIKRIKAASLPYGD